MYPIINYIPRFVEKNNYASSFGFEWNKFSKLRSDHYNKTNIIRNTILKRSGWDDHQLIDKLLLECGCGAGNDTEILLNLGAKVIAFDYSISVESAFENNKHKQNFLILQADIYKIPLKMELFDIVFCHRVIQHTPDPEEAFYSIIKYLKKGGEIFLHSYDLFFWTLFHYKYLLRPITKRLNHRYIFKILEIIGPILYPIVGRIQESRNIRFLKNFLLRIIPFDNLDYTLINSKLTKKEKYEYSLLNVFDRLAPKYDNPNSAKSIIRWFKNMSLKKIVIRERNPIIVTAIKE